MDREELFRKKILGQLTPAEESSLSALFQEDPDAQLEFQEFQAVMAAVIEGEKAELKEFLTGIEKEEKKIIPMRWISIAAGLVLLIGFSYIFWPKPNTPDLYGTYFDTYPNVYLPITRNQIGEDSLLSVAFFQYESGQFEKASQSFSLYTESSDAKDEVHFYQAMSLMQVDSLSQAESILTTLNSPDFDYADEVSWYRALLLLKNGQEEEAISALTELKDKKSSFKREEVEALLEKLGAK
ncbi:MAG: hypothetical protein AAF388_18815, partial [Bacteroidota bacterium]